MPENNSLANKRIAKNTVLLYMRMLLLLAISLYTSRIVLNTLGVTDYGIYNVVGGVITILGFVTGSLGGATSRYITTALGKGDKHALLKLFSSILFIHYFAGAIIFVLSETVGLWFVLTQLNIPTGRMPAAMWVYQLSILAAIVNMISIPYNAVIIAHEKMSAFAYISLLDATLKLLIAFLLQISPTDKLILYSVLILLVQLLDRLLYYFYCQKHFEETRTKAKYNKELFREISAYAGWTITGELSVVGYTQGLNVLLNIFFNPAVNAARGIAVQIQGICSQFSTNFEMALNPQITKNYAQGNLERMHHLIIHGSKFSYYIFFFILLPLMLEAPFVLKIWLGEVPPYSVIFLRLTLVIGILFTLKNFIIVAVHATGTIKRFQIMETSMLLSIVPIAYIGLKYFHFAPESVFIVHIAVEIVTQLVRLMIVLPMIGMSMLVYMKKVVLPLVVVTIIAPVLPTVLYMYLGNAVVNFFVVCLAAVVSSCLTIYYIGCTGQERSFINAQLASVASKFNISFKK